FAASQTEGEEAVKLNPGDSRIRVTVGMAYLQGGRPDLAEPHFKAAVDANPGAPDAYASLCWLYRMQNRLGELEATLQHLARITPQGAAMLRMQLAQGQPMPGLFAPAAQNAAPGWPPAQQPIQNGGVPPQLPPKLADLWRKLTTGS